MAPLGLQQTLSQRMALAPQMRHSLELLQAPAMELGQLLRREAERNPVLEILPPPSVSSLEAARDDWAHRRTDETSDIRDDGAPPEIATEAPVRSGASAQNGESAENGLPDGDFSVMGQLDDLDYFYTNGGNNEYDPDAEERRNFFLDSIPAVESLQEHLALQLGTLSLTPGEEALVEEIVGSLDDDGYLRTPLADIAQAHLASLEEAEKALAVVQTLDPPGIGARDLRECLLLQIAADSPRDRAGRCARRLLENPEAFALVASPNRTAKISALLEISPEIAEEGIKYLSNLDPRPGRRYAQDRTQFVNVEIEVKNVGGKWTAFLDKSGIPRVSLGQEWLKRRDELRSNAGKKAPSTESKEQKEERRWLDEKIREAEFLLLSLTQRETTLLATAQAIADSQTDYFERGPVGLKPLSMAEIARKTGMSESTVSRTVSGKWLRSPQGVVPLRYFFTSAVQTTGNSAGGASSEAVRAMLKSVIAAEDPRSPLSDQAIAGRLAEKGIKIARRTVAKYRDMLHIPGAAERMKKDVF